MKKIKILLALLITLTAVTAYLCGNACAANRISGNWGYTVDEEEGTAGIRNYIGSGNTSLTIPSSLGGYPVTWIAYGAFDDSDMSSVDTLTIPKSIRHIGLEEFDRFKNIRRINFNAEECSDVFDAFKTAGKSSGSLQVVFGPSVREIPHDCFANSYVSSVIISNGVKGIGVDAFRGCSKLTSVTIPKSVTYLYSEAFRNCKGLKKVTILNRNLDISAWCFNDCPSDMVIRCYRGGATARNAKELYKCRISYIDKLISSCKTNLSKTGFVYSGKVFTPAVTVKDGSVTLTKGTHYTVTYQKNKAVGTATVTVKSKGSSYYGTVKKTFTIKPKGTVIRKVAPISKGFAVAVKKQTVQTSGYQVQYALNRAFKNAVTKNLKGTKRTKAICKKLKAKKKYYVRVRTYKTVSGKKYYSTWSKVKAVTTKK